MALNVTTNPELVHAVAGSDRVEHEPQGSPQTQPGAFAPQDQDQDHRAAEQGPSAGADAGGLTHDGNKDDDLTAPRESFDEMGLQDEILRGIYACGFERPSAIQARAILPVLSGRDVVAQAQSGTGKTATFSVGILQRVDPALRAVQALVLAPTRELVGQIAGVMSHLGDFLDVDIHACVGGTSVRDNIQALKRGVQIVVGTPGRVLDLVENRRALHLQDLKVLCLDEADEMLQEGFLEQVQQLFRTVPEQAQACVFSATLPLAVMETTNKFMRDPVRVLVKREELTLKGIKQYFVALDQEEWKLDTLCDLYETMNVTQAIIYCNTKRKVDWLAEEMTARDHTVSCIHADLDPRERNIVMKEFRSGSTRVLIATDVLARGIDVQGVSLVLNFDLPPKRESYIHRIGRSGRFGRKGVAINFITPQDVRYMHDIEQFYHTEVNEMPSAIDHLL